MVDVVVHVIIGDGQVVAIVMRVKACVEHGMERGIAGGKDYHYTGTPAQRVPRETTQSPYNHSPTVQSDVNRVKRLWHHRCQDLGSGRSAYVLETTRTNARFGLLEALGLVPLSAVRPLILETTRGYRKHTRHGQDSDHGTQLFVCG